MSLDRARQTSYEDDDIKIFFENGVVTGRFKVEHVTLEIAKKVSDWRMKLSNYKPHLAISDVRMILRMDPEVRKFFASDEACENVVAGAIIVKSNFQRIAGNFFILIDKPQIPARLFTTEEEALHWLGKYELVETLIN